MGFLINLAGDDHDKITAAANEIVPTLVAVIDRVKAGQAAVKVLSREWFGDDGAPWLTVLKGKLNLMRAAANLQTIRVSCAPVAERSMGGAAYVHATHSLPDVGTANAAAAHGDLKIFLDSGSLRYPKFYDGASDATRDSIFQTLVHELSHLVINTTDSVGGVNCYGITACRALAVANSAGAKTIADCWGYFVESSRHG